MFLSLSMTVHNSQGEQRGFSGRQAKYGKPQKNNLYEKMKLRWWQSTETQDQPMTAAGQLLNRRGRH